MQYDATSNFALMVDCNTTHGGSTPPALTELPAIIVDPSDELVGTALAGIRSRRHDQISNDPDDFRALAEALLMDAFGNLVAQYELQLATPFEHCCQNNRCLPCLATQKGYIYPVEFKGSTLHQPLRIEAQTYSGVGGAFVQLMICVTGDEVPASPQP
jgi:hypothetical protein